MVTTVLGADGVLLPYSGATTKGFGGTSGPEVVRGTSGNDSFRAGGGGDTLYGLAGDDTYNIYDSRDVIVENPGEGIDTVLATVSYILPANVENLTLTGDKTFGGGNNLNNILTGGAGIQTLSGAGGNDVMTGGAGADVFALTRGAAHDVVTDFTAGLDHIRLDSVGFTSFAQVRAAMSQVGADVLISAPGGEQLWLRNHQITDFARQDFQLSLDTSRLTQTFDDEFNSLSLYNLSTKQGTWWTAYGSAPTLQNHTLTVNNELQIYVDPTFAGTGSTPLGINPFSVSNGVVSINANLASAADSASLWGYQYTSGMLTTRMSFAQQYGYFETRAAMPVGKGFWPAFWLLPTSQNGPAEIDIFEQLGRDPNNIYLTAHTNTPGYATSTTTQTYVATPNQFHTYGMLWDQSYLVWYVDGVEVGRQVTTPDMQQPMYILLNLAVGGSWPGSPDASTVFPGQFQIDYVRAYSFNNSSANHAPTAAADSYSVGVGVPLTVTGAGLLTNDSDPDGDRLNATLYSGPAHGKLALNADGSFTYTPNAGYSGADSFTYRAADGDLMSTPTTVSLTVGGSQPPPAQSPTGTLPSGLTATEQVALSLKAVGLSIADPDGTNSTETVVLSVGEGALTVAAGTSGAVVGGSGTGSVTITGTVAQINALLSTDASSSLGYFDSLDAPAASTALTLNVQDATGLSATATATLTINPVNDAPIVVSDSASVQSGATLNLSAASLLANDSDPDGNTLTITGVAMAANAHGVVSLSNGVITYTPNAGYLGSDSFIYYVSDGIVTTPVPGVVSVTVASSASTYTYGTSGDDIFDFSARTNPQLVNGGAGNDIIKGGSANDGLNGGDGNDTVIGGSGGDNIKGGNGSDLMTGNGGADRFIFDAVGEFGPASNRDVITDFSTAEGDKIQLTSIDAAAAASGNQAFTFIGTSAFTHVAGQLHYAISGANAIISGDVNGDGVADFQLMLLGVTNLTASDFIL